MSTKNKVVATEVDDTPKNFSWDPYLAIGATILIYFGAQILGGLLVSIYPIARGWTSEVTSLWFENSVLAQFLFVFIIALISVWLLTLVLKRKNATLADIGLIKPKVTDPVYALLGALIYILLTVVVLLVANTLIPGLDAEQSQQLGFDTARAPLELILVFVSLVLLPSFVEEILMRGFLYHSLKTRWKKWLAALVTSVLFAAAHLQFGSGAPLLWVAAIDTFVLSLVLIWLVEKTGSLWPAIWLHMIKNGVAFVALFVIR